MQLMSFKFSDFHANYLKSVVKGSGMTMRDYLEALIDDQIGNSGLNFAIALVIQGDKMFFCDQEKKSEVLVNSVTGDSIHAFITDNQTPELVSAFKIIMTSELNDGTCDVEDDGSISGQTSVFLSSGEAAAERLDGMFPFDIKEAIFQ